MKRLFLYSVILLIFNFNIETMNWPWITSSKLGILLGLAHQEENDSLLLNLPTELLVKIIESAVEDDEESCFDKLISLERIRSTHTLFYNLLIDNNKILTFAQIDQNHLNTISIGVVYPDIHPYYAKKCYSIILKMV